MVRGVFIKQSNAKWFLNANKKNWSYALVSFGVKIQIQIQFDEKAQQQQKRRKQKLRANEVIGRMSMFLWLDHFCW